jgi:hypothetical protein
MPNSLLRLYNPADLHDPNQHDGNRIEQRISDMLYRRDLQYRGASIYRLPSVRVRQGTLAAATSTEPIRPIV